MNGYDLIALFMFVLTAFAMGYRTGYVSGYNYRVQKERDEKWREVMIESGEIAPDEWDRLDRMNGAV